MSSTGAAGAANAAQRSQALSQNENRRAGSRRGPTPSMRDAGGGVGGLPTPFPPLRVVEEAGRGMLATPTRPGSDSHAIAAKRRPISLPNVPEARLRGVGLHAGPQDVVQGAHRRVRVLLGVLERHASIEQPVVPGQVP